MITPAYVGAISTWQLFLKIYAKREEFRLIWVYSLDTFSKLSPVQMIQVLLKFGLLCLQFQISYLNLKVSYFLQSDEVATPGACGKSYESWTQRYAHASRLIAVSHHLF